MLRVTIIVDAPGWQAQGIKESLAMELERYGDCRVVSVEDLDRAEQMAMEPEPVSVRRAWALPQSAAQTAPSGRLPQSAAPTAPSEREPIASLHEGGGPAGGGDGGSNIKDSPSHFVTAPSGRGPE